LGAEKILGHGGLQYDKCIVILEFDKCIVNID
jgi:hypothetical protein